MKTKLFAFSTLVSSVVLLTGCIGPASTPVNDSTNSGGNNASADASKTLLTIGTFDGGFGTQWLSNAAKRFEEKYADQSFEAGKKGVVVRVDGQKDAYSGAQLLNKTLERDIYFTEQVSYFDFLNRGKMADISDVVKGSLSDFGESKTIEDKMDPAFKSYLTAKDNKYYAVPFYDGFLGIVYDKDLFDQESFYLGMDGNIISDKDQEKSSGPDGVKGTSDDGLPATYTEFNQLLKAIRSAGMTPFSYAGGDASQYPERAILNFFATNEGKDAMNLNYTLNGTAKIADVAADGSFTTTDTTITEDNGYLLQKMPGKYQALQFMKDIMLGDASNFDINAGSVSHMNAQTNFIAGYSKKRDQYAMLIDGSWWENEASGAFASVERLYGVKKIDRHFAWMPIPFADPASVGQKKQTYVSQNSSFGFVSANTAHLDLAKLFMKFINTDAELSAFTAETSTTRALNYEVTASDQANLTSFAKSICELKKTADIVYPYSSLVKQINHPSDFSCDTWYWAATINHTDYTNPFLAFQENKADARSYFLGSADYHGASFWSNLK